MSDCIGWLSKNSLNRYRPAILYTQYSLFVFGVMFWIDANLGADGFKEETWGAFAYFFPAKMWAALNMGASALAIIGLKKPIRSWMVAIGAALHCVQFGAISYSATYTGGEMIVGMFASVYLLPIHMWLFYEAANRWKASPSSSLCRQ